ncbi:MAG: hypothetical protein QM811_22505 [Pirellulales bacterium]
MRGVRRPTARRAQVVVALAAHPAFQRVVDRGDRVAAFRSERRGRGDARGDSAGVEQEVPHAAGAPVA